MILNASYPCLWEWVRAWLTSPIQPNMYIYIYVTFGSVPLNSKAGLDPGLNLLMQRTIHLGMRIWFLDWRPHVWKPLQFASLPLFPWKSFCLQQLSPLNMAARSMSLLLGLALETTPKLLTYTWIYWYLCISMGCWCPSQPWADLRHWSHGCEMVVVYKKWSLSIKKWSLDNLHF